jgi:hypothetical protein
MADYTLGITGSHSDAIADCHNECTPVFVEATMGPDYKARTVIDAPTIRKALGVANLRQANITGLQFETHNPTDGVVGVTVQKGNGDPLPITQRACFATGVGAGDSSGVVAMNHVAKPGIVSSSQPAKLKGNIPGIEHDLAHEISPDMRDNNHKTCAFYPGHDKPLTKESAFKNTIEASNDGQTLIGVPIKETACHQTDGIMTHVVSRALGGEAKPGPLAKRLSPTGKVMKLPTIEGKDALHFVDTKESFDKIYNDLSTKVNPPSTLEHGIAITHHFLDTTRHKPGDRVWTQCKINRHVPEDVDGHKVLLRSDIAGSMAMPSLNPSAEPSVGEKSKWEKDLSAAMFGTRAGSSAKAAITAGDGEVPEASAAEGGGADDN